MGFDSCSSQETVNLGFRPIGTRNGIIRAGSTDGLGYPLKRAIVQPFHGVDGSLFKSMAREAGGVFDRFMELGLRYAIGDDVEPVTITAVFGDAAFVLDNRPYGDGPEAVLSSFRVLHHQVCPHQDKASGTP